MKSKGISQMIERRILELLDERGNAKSMYELQKSLTLSWITTYRHVVNLVDAGKVAIRRNGMRWVVEKRQDGNRKIR